MVPAAGRTVGLSDREARSVVSGLVQIDSAIDFASQRRASENNGAHGAGDSRLLCPHDRESVVGCKYAIRQNANCPQEFYTAL